MNVWIKLITAMTMPIVKICLVHLISCTCNTGYAGSGALCQRLFDSLSLDKKHAEKHVKYMPILFVYTAKVIFVFSFN